jgi:hypothetical protein
MELVKYLVWLSQNPFLDDEKKPRSREYAEISLLSIGLLHRDLTRAQFAFLDKDEPSTDHDLPDYVLHTVHDFGSVEKELMSACVRISEFEDNDETNQPVTPSGIKRPADLAEQVVKKKQRVGASRQTKADAVATPKNRASERLRSSQRK